MSRMGAICRKLLGLTIGGAYAFSTNCASAQIAPDRTLPNNSNVILNSSIFNITGGTKAGRNLFHSFQQFSLPTGGTASFNNGLDIQNIISRVTGGTISNIDGIIRANGTANLFFLNPNGIVFGRNASLNIGGSFVATTANALQFGNQGVFNVSVPNNPALLTVNPSALLYNQIVRGASIQNSSIASADVAPTGLSSSGLRVPDGKSLLLVGGDVTMDGGRLRAYGGRVELGGLAASGTVGLRVDGDNLSLSFPPESFRGSVSLIDGASVNVSAGGGGSITVNAGNLNITGGSQLIAGIASSLGSVGSQAGDIKLNATGEIKIDGRGSGASNVVNPQAIGNAGNVTLSSNSLSLTGGARISTSTFGKGNAGNVIINATKSVFLENATVYSDVGDINYFGNNFVIGKGGNIEINTAELSLNNTELSASTFGRGDAGNVIINATKSVSLNGNNTTIFSSVGDVNNFLNFFARGNGGNIEISTGELSLTNGAQLITGTLGQGNSGNVIINATKSVSLDNANIFSSVGDVNSILNLFAKGNGGNIEISTGELLLNHDAQLATTTLGQGNAGNVIINATKSVSLNGNNTTIFATVGSFNNTGNNIIKGNGGNIEISTSELSLTNGAELLVNSFGSGNTGNVIVNATRRVFLDGQYIDNQGNSFPTGIFSNVVSIINSSKENSFVKSKGGNIQVTTGELLLSNGAELDASAFGQSDAGNIDIGARSIRLDNGFITSQTTSGNGGNITLAPQDFLLLRHGSQISTSAGLLSASGNGGNITINTPNGFVVAVANENNDITANASLGAGGLVQIKTLGIYNFNQRSLEDLEKLLGTNDPNNIDTQKLPTNDITAISLTSPALSGQVNVITPEIDPSNGLATLPTVTEATPKLAAPTCAAFNEYGGGSNFIITGRGGLPPSPDDPLTSDVVWLDTRLPVTTTQHHKTKTHAAQQSSQPKAIAIVPATGWVFNDKGEVTLISSVANATGLGYPRTSCLPR